MMNLIEQSFAKGEQKGDLKVRKIVKALKSRGMDTDTIAEISGLSKEEVERL